MNTELILIFVNDIDGHPLGLDEIEKDLPACSAKVLLESKWTFITQEVHFPNIHCNHFFLLISGCILLFGSCQY